jgi:hypothetical protein
VSVCRSAFLLASAAVLLAAPGGAEEVSWDRVPGPARTAALVAVASDAEGAVAAAFRSGVWLRRDAIWSRHAVHGDVRDVAFDAAGQLWVAGSRGVWLLDAQGRMQPQHPGAGERARDVQRLATHGRLVAVASAVGLSLRSSGSA